MIFLVLTLSLWKQFISVQDESIPGLYEFGRFYIGKKFKYIHIVENVKTKIKCKYNHGYE